MLLEAALATDCITLFFSFGQHFAKLHLSLRVGCYLLRPTIQARATPISGLMLS
jgi:hypothetical protein